jgi:hypothetical protein
MKNNGVLFPSQAGVYLIYLHYFGHMVGIKSLILISHIRLDLRYPFVISNKLDLDHTPNIAARP